WVLNGPNLNLLGTREPAIYGSATLAEIERSLADEGARLGVEVACFQSNEEGALVTRVQEARGRANGLIVNFGAYSHTSIALRGAAPAPAASGNSDLVSTVAQRADVLHRYDLSGIEIDGPRILLRRGTAHITEPASATQEGRPPSTPTQLPAALPATPAGSAA